MSDGDVHLDFHGRSTRAYLFLVSVRSWLEISMSWSRGWDHGLSRWKLSLWSCCPAEMPSYQLNIVILYGRGTRHSVTSVMICAVGSNIKLLKGGVR